MSREMPNAVSLEQSVLGSLMVYPRVIQDCQELDLHAEEFYLPSHQQIYQAICTIHENGQPIDMNTVVTRLQETDQLESSQGTDYIIRLADSAISSATSRSYIETIKNKAQLRRLIYVADKISEEGYSSGEDIDTVLDDAERLVMDVTRHRRGSEFESSEEIVTRVINELKELRTMKGVTGIETGYVLLDRMT
ncbi:replicative DNA helicase, partial [Holdemanella biformis]